MKKLMYLVMSIAMSLFAADASAQYIPVTTPGSCIVDGSGSTITAGTMIVVGTDANDNPIPYRAGTSAMATTAPISRAIVNGALLTSLQLADPASTSPTNVLYRFAIQDNLSKKITVYKQIIVANNDSGNFNFCKMNPLPFTTQIQFAAAPFSFSGDWNLLGHLNVALSSTFNQSISAPKVNGITFVDGITNTTITGALSSLSGSGIVFVPNGTYTGSTQIALTTGQSLQAAPCSNAQQSSVGCGAIVRWTGTSNTAVITVHDASKVIIRGLTIDCGVGNTGMTGILYSSDNAPGADGLIVEDNTFLNCHQGITIGRTDGTIVNCVSTPNDAGCAEADQGTFQRNYFYGNASDLTGEGIHLNDANGGQQTEFKLNYFAQVNKGVHLVRTNGGLKFIHNGPLGNAVGTTPELFTNDVNVSQPIKYENNEMEGANLGLHDSSCVGTTPTLTLENNQFFTTATFSVKVDGCAFVQSISENGQTGSHQVGGTAKVLSLGDTRVWTTTAGGTVDSWYNGNFTTGGSIAAGTSISATTSVSAATTVGAGTTLIGQNVQVSAVANTCASSSKACFGWDATNTRAAVNNNNAQNSDIGLVVASGTATFTATAVAGGTCQTTITVAATNAANPDTIAIAYASAPTAATDGLLIINKWITANNVNFARCNPTAASITPTALVLNWKVVR